MSVIAAVIFCITIVCSHCHMLKANYMNSFTVCVCMCECVGGWVCVPRVIEIVLIK